MGQYKVTTTKEEFIEYAPCIKCGCDEVKFVNCGYSSFNVGYGECTKCNHSVKCDIDWNSPDSEIIRYWNRENDPVQLIQTYEREIINFNDKIRSLKIGIREFKKKIKKLNKK
jgi:hypothetical protein